MMRNHAGDVIYVGKAKSLRNRLRSYFQATKNLTPKTATLVSHIEEIETIVVDSELEALILENNLIKEYKPKYNIALKDDKNYPYIKITLADEYPKIIMTRNRLKDGGKYFGPFTSVFAVKKTIEAITKIYPLRRCNKNLHYCTKVGRPCLNYHIGQCPAPCLGNVPPDEYRKSIDDIIEILSGQDKELQRRLEAEMKAAAESQDYERAAALRDQIEGIRHIVERQKIIRGSEQEQDIIALASDDELACVQVFNVRDGKMLGREHAYLGGVAEASTAEILTTFVKQFYVDKPHIPKEIVLETALLPEEEPVVADWLSGIRGSKVTFTVPKIGQKARMIEMVKKNAALTLEAHETELREKEERRKSKLDSLKDLLGLAAPPVRIEAFDISNISGTDNVGGMVVYTDGFADKKAYRRFRIKEVEGQNDYGSMQEMIFRRLERGLKEEAEGKSGGSFLPFPQLFLIDGGKTHVEAVKSITAMYPQLNIAVAGMVKDDKHKIRGLIYEGEEYPLKPATVLGKFLTDISEEVHRYAITYHRTLRKKGMLASELEDIPGIGKKRREALMRHFGSVNHLKEASLDELTTVPGLGQKAAEAVYHYYQEEKEKANGNEQ